MRPAVLRTEDWIVDIPVGTSQMPEGFHMMFGQAGKRALPRERGGRSTLFRSLSSLILRPNDCGLLAIAVVISAATPAQAQEGVITGTVTNIQTREPVNAAQVFIPGTNNGVITDREGQYRLEGVPAGQVMVEVRLIGYRTSSDTVEVAPGRRATLDFRLEVSAIELEDVTVNVVTGLERRRRQEGTNTGNIDATALSHAPIQNFSNLLPGRTEGVILQDVSGTTGTSQRIRIRGSNSLLLSNEPLIVVDGTYFNNTRLYGNSGTATGMTGGQEPSRLNDLSVGEVEAVEVLKGPAATALYGAAGANGVIVITTKRGSPGGTDWEFYAEFAELEDRADYPLNYSAIQVLGDANEPVFSEEGFNFDDYESCYNHEAAAGLCQQDRFLTFDTTRDPRTTPFQKGNRTRYGVKVSGGAPTTTYFLSGEYAAEDGVLKLDVSHEEQWNLRTNLDANLANDLTASLRVGFVSRDVGFLCQDNCIYSPIVNVIGGMAGFVPGGHPDPETGGPNPLNFWFQRNFEDLAEAGLSTQETERLTGSIHASWQPTSWLTATGTAGIDLISNFDFVTIQPGLDNLTRNWIEGFRNAARYQRQTWTANASLSAEFTLPGTSITSVSTAGASYREELLNGVQCFGSGLIEGTDSCASTSVRFDVDEQFLNVVTVGAFFQQELGWANKLFLTGSVRADDDSNFGGNSRLQAYPSASVSYLPSEEGWFPEGGVVSELRLRGAFGMAGARPGFRDAITVFAPTATTLDGETIAAVTLAETGNELLRPERSTEWEAGLDIGLFSDNIGIEFTYFDKRTKDALIERPLPPSYGLTSLMFQNLGEIRNRGTEISLSAHQIGSRDVRTSLSLQWTRLKNEILELGEGIEPVIFSGGQRHMEGFPAGSFHQKPYSWDDANGDGLVSTDEVSVEDEAVFIDEAAPTWTVSFAADVELFEFLRLSTLFDARGGYSNYNRTEEFRCQRFADNRSRAGRGCRANSGQNAPLEEQAASIAQWFHGTSAGFLQKADFIKWRELSLTLTAPPSLATKHPLLERSSLTFAGRNLGTFTGYPGLDPEANDRGASANFAQREFNTQPPVRVFTVRLDVRF
jgi:TonB-linked SusC/RagA family outer membrane protein